MIIHLNEDRFLRMFLIEATTEEIYQKYYSDIPYQTYCAILRLDPTYSNNRMGKYTKWLLNIYRKGTFSEGDFGETKELLTVYDKYKNVIEVKDIMKLNSMGELYQVVQPYMGGDKATSKSDAAKKIKNGAEKVYDDGQWTIIIPHTMEAAQLYGKNTRWCTAAEKSENMFDYYNSKGPLYINIDKANNRKYQFHFETASFMDEEDEPIFYDDDDSPSTPDVDTPLCNMIGMTQGAKKYYEQLFRQGNVDVVQLVFSPQELLEELIKNKINTSRFDMDVVNDDPASPGEVAPTKILGWATLVEYRSSHVIEKRVTNRWFRDISPFTTLNKPIVGKKGTHERVASAIFDEHNDSVLIDDKGNVISNAIFFDLPIIASNGYAVASYTPKEYNGEILCNIFNLNNGCTPVFDEPFKIIQGSQFNSDGKNVIAAVKYKGNEIWDINAYGFEFNYSGWMHQMVEKYENDMVNYVKSNYLIEKERRQDQIKSQAEALGKSYHPWLNNDEEAFRRFFIDSCADSFSTIMVREIDFKGPNGKEKRDFFEQVKSKLRMDLSTAIDGIISRNSIRNDFSR